MNLRVVGRVLGLLMVATGAAMLLPLLVCLLYGEREWSVFLSCMMGALAAGCTLAFLLRGTQDLRVKDGFLTVSLGWLLVGVLGALPFWVSGAIPDPTDAIFESVSGFTTTGASILDDIESLGHGILFWRALIQWLGGMGIVVLSIAILPILGVGGMQLFKAESPGPAPDRLTPRIKETAKLLWGVYVVVSAAEVLALLACGMSLFDAVCHTFTTMATGGFSVRNASVGAYANPSVDVVVTVFMFLAGVNFSLHYVALKGHWRRYFQDGEFRTYLTVVLSFTVIVALTNLANADMGIGDNLRTSAFQVVSIVTTTGFGTADYETWAHLAQFSLLFLMFVGGCAGSTGGGMKNVRFLLLTKHAYNELRKLLHPRGVYVIRYNDRTVPEEIVTNILGFFLLLAICTTLATFTMAMLGLDIVSAFASVAATINNIGPGLGSVGPTDNFAMVPSLGKWVLILCMLLGRLELYTMLVLITPDFWRRF
jgi:trk system potassium uptake protein TrkH